MALIWPVLAHIALALCLLLATGASRVRAIQSGAVKLKDVALSNTAWPDQCRKFANNYANQFETPVLFYALIGIAIYVGETGIAAQGLAWAFIVTRLLHTAIHVTANNVRQRFYAFITGVACLVALWVVIVLRLAGATT
ncbi:MAG: MAPEG family protein [Hyphomicrobiaceae bacterium]|nr:MAPEG family protein [Hyphomicrobiaceae bacterium]